MYIWIAKERMMLSNNNDAYTQKKYVAQDICTTY